MESNPGHMGRTRRLVVPGGVYHVASRGNNKQVIFDDGLRRLHIRNLGEIAAEYGWSVVAWAILSNHYHLVLKIGDAGLAPGMQKLNLRLARASNARFDRINHCVGQPYWSGLIDTREYFEASILYTLWNPARAGIEPHPGDTSWSSFRATVGLDWKPSALDTNELLRYFGHTPTAAVQSFERWVWAGRQHALRRWVDRDNDDFRSPCTRGPSRPREASAGRPWR
jgi:REP element-mobilizing transposase RayT